jgi:hypothetical protein
MSVTREALYVTNRALQLLLGRIPLNACRSCGICSSVCVRVGDCKRFATVDGPLGETTARNIPVAFQDLFCGDFGVLFEEVGVRQNRLQVFRNLNYSMSVYLAHKNAAKITYLAHGIIVRNKRIDSLN